MDDSAFVEFVALAEKKNLAEAADELFVSEPTLSRHIRILEAELGIELFERTPKGLFLNENGEMFLPYAKEVIKLRKQLNDALYDAATQDKQMISVCSGYKVAELMVDYHAAYPEVIMRINYQVNDRPLLMDNLKSHQYGFVISDLPETIPDFVTAIPLKSYEYRLIVSPNHPLAKNDVVQLRDIGNESFLDTLKRETDTDRIVIDAFRGVGVIPKVSKHMETGRQLREAIRNQEGVAIRRWNKSEDDYDGLVSIPLQPPLRTNVYLCYLKGRKLKKIEQEFVDFVSASAH